MRAARILDLLLLLQRHDGSTARQLAEQLEVSERTILRDVEALSEAGVPVYATQGRGGGIQLLDGFQTRLTGLTVDESRVLFLVGQPQVAHRLGLGAVVRTVRDKLLEALPGGLDDEATGLLSWFLHDPDPWTGNRIPHGELRRLAACIQRHRVVEIAVGHELAVAVRPFGLVLKAGSWHLVCADGYGDGVEVRCIDELRSTRITKNAFDPPTDFQLEGFWRMHVEEQAGEVGSV